MPLRREMVNKSDPGLDERNQNSSHGCPKTRDEKYPACRGHAIPDERDRVGGRGQIADSPIEHGNADTQAQEQEAQTRLAIRKG